LVQGLRRGVSALPKEGEYLYPFCVETKAALNLGGGGITGGMYELGALSARWTTSSFPAGSPGSLIYTWGSAPEVSWRLSPPSPDNAAP